ncbi:MAG: hypothetical protein ACKO2N_02265 [Tabrizicola sp.]
MGREAEGHAVWQGLAGAVKAVLESDTLTLRGEVRARFPRNALSAWRADRDDLCLSVDGLPLTLTLGAKEALAWVRALDKPLPSLAEKLGISESRRPWVIGGPMPEELAEAVAGLVLPGPEGAALIIAVLTRAEELGEALAAGKAHGLRLWCVHGKGKDASVPDAEVRAVFRAAGWMDIKTSAVSARFSSTLYRPG